MSRTRKDQPIRVSGREWHEAGGHMRGIGEAGTRWWRSTRKRARNAMRNGIEPEPSRPRNSNRYAWW